MNDDVSDRPLEAHGAAGQKILRPGDVSYFEAGWIDSHDKGGANYDLIPGVPKRLDGGVTRLTARNASLMTGPGTNTYLVGDRELAVIDPGPADPAHIELILASAAGRIRWIICTHTHPDHAAGVAALQRATGAPVAGRPGTVTEHDVPVPFDRILEDGESIDCGGFALRAILTPGHASNHVCLLVQATGMLLTGDHIIQGSTVVIWPPDGNMRAYLGSLRRLTSLPISILAPGHGYLMGQPHQEAERLIRHRLAREDKVRKALSGAGGSAAFEELLPRVYDDVPAAIHSIAAHSLRAHLEKLIEDGEMSHAGGQYRLM